MLTLFLLIGLAYFLGSIPTGKIVGRYYGIDIQKHGSGNIGFANAVRVLGKKPAIIVLAGDILKGFIPTLLATRYVSISMAAVVGACAIAGHIFTFWLGFKGGKGVATGFGVMLALSPLVALGGIAVYCISIWVYKKSAPSSITAACSLPLLSLLFGSPYVAFSLMLAVVCIWTHRSNIKAFALARIDA